MKRKIIYFIIRQLYNLYFGLDVLIIYPLLMLLLPSRIPYWFIQKRGDLMYRLSKKTRARIRKAMRERLPETLTAAEIDDLVRRYFRTQTAFFFDTYYASIMYRRKWISRFVTVEGREHLDRSLAGGKGIIMPTLHFPHPYHTTAYLGYLDYSVTAYAVHPWDLNVPFTAKLNAWLGIRIPMMRMDLQIAWARRGGYRTSRERLAANSIFLAILDAPLPNRKDLEVVDFMGKPTMFPRRITNIIYETGAPVHVGTTARDDADWRKVTLTISPELTMTGEPVTDLQTIISALSERIRANPDQWWGWADIEKGTPEYHEQYKRWKEAEEAKKKGG